MKAIRIHEYGGPEVLVYEEVPTPEPGPAQILVRVEAATVNPVDVAVREDRFPTPKAPPKTLGSDGAGVVEQVGHDVSSVKPGDEVFFSGTAAEITPVSLVGEYSFKPGKACETLLNAFNEAVTPKKVAAE